MASERGEAAAQFLQRAGLGAARREPLAGDASTRRYERLFRPSGPSLIFMDQPPRAESPPCPPGASPAERAALGFNAIYRLAAGRVDAFVACAGWLRAQGLSAPRVTVADPAAGFAVLEDLGDDLYARLIAAGADEETLYAAAIAALVRMQAAEAPAVLAADGVSWPLLTYDALALETAGDLFLDWQPRFAPALVFDEAAWAEWRAIFASVIARGEAGAAVFCHRDFHAENLIWLPARAGAGACGLLDFQDALRAHPAWDLTMLLHDARRDVSPEREAWVLDRYLAARPELDREAFAADYAGLGALNIARILGIFARLVVRDGKPRYAGFMGRLWAYLDRLLTGPAPAGLAGWIERHAPAEKRRLS